MQVVLRKRILRNLDHYDTRQEIISGLAPWQSPKRHLAISDLLWPDAGLCEITDAADDDEEEAVQSRAPTHEDMFDMVMSNFRDMMGDPGFPQPV